MELPSVTVAKQLAWEMESRKSVELQVHFDIISPDFNSQNPESFNAIEEHYIETALGQRVCDVTHLRDGLPTKHYTYYDQGSRCAEVAYSKDDLKAQQSVTIKRVYRTEDQMGDRAERPQPLQVLYVGREPLHKALTKAKSLGESRFLDRDCDVFLFEKVRWVSPQDHVYYLDRETSIPLKVKSFKDEASRQKQEPLWVWKAQSVDKVQGHAVPLKSELTTPLAGTASPYVWKYEVKSVEFGKEYPESTFWPTIQPGVDVFGYLDLEAIQDPRSTATGTGCQAGAADHIAGGPSQRPQRMDGCHIGRHPRLGRRAPRRCRSLPMASWLTVAQA